MSRVQEVNEFSRVTGFKEIETMQFHSITESQCNCDKRVWMY